MSCRMKRWYASVLTIQFNIVFFSNNQETIYIYFAFRQFEHLRFRLLESTAGITRQHISMTNPQAWQVSYTDSFKYLSLSSKVETDLTDKGTPGNQQRYRWKSDIWPLIPKKWSAEVFLCNYLIVLMIHVLNYNHLLELLDACKEIDDRSITADVNRSFHQAVSIKFVVCLQSRSELGQVVCACIERYRAIGYCLRNDVNGRRFDSDSKLCPVIVSPRSF